MRLLSAVSSALVALALFPAAAQGYSNGQIPGSARAPIYNPANAPQQTLAKGGPVEAWNTLNLGLYQQHHSLLYSAGDGAAYRPLSGPGFTQNYAWYLYQHGGNLAAYPGTSRHGLAAAVDLGYPSWMRPLFDARGPPLGWSWGWVPSENWHVEYHGSFGHPDPGVSPAHPDLKLGSGGRYQSVSVTQVQRRLLALGYYHHRPGAPSTYNEATRLAVYTFQVARGFAVPSGTVTRETWLALRQVQAGKPTQDHTANAVAKLAGLKHGDRGDAVSQLSRDLAFVRHHSNHAANFYHGPVLRFFTVGLAGALRAWQTDNHLSATAVYDLQSQKLMATSVRYWRKKLCVAGAPAASYCAHPTIVPVVAAAGSPYFSDISGNNASVDLKAYAASKHNIIAIKLTEGDGFRSDSAAARWRYADQLHLVRLAYDFARPSQNSCTAEADNFAGYAHQVGWHAGDVAVLDWEDPGYHSNGNAWVRCWATRLAVLHIRAGVVYSYGSYIAGTLSTTLGMGYWHAQYSGSQTNTSTAPGFALQHLIAVQFTDGIYGATPHSIGGIAGDVSKLTVPLSALTALAQR